MAKRIVTWKTDINVSETNSVRFYLWSNVKQAVVNGCDFRVWGEKFDPNIASYPENTRFAILDGIKDSVRDAGALPAGSSDKAKLESMLDRANYLMEGAPHGWLRKGVRAPSETSLLYRAIAMVFAGVKPEDVIAKMKDQAKQKDIKWETYRASMLKSKKLRDAVDQIRAEEAKGIDGDDLLDELEMDSEDEDEADYSEMDESDDESEADTSETDK